MNDRPAQSGLAYVARALLAAALVVVCGALVVWLPGWLGDGAGEYPELATTAAVIALLTVVAWIEAKMRG